MSQEERDLIRALSEFAFGARRQCAVSPFLHRFPEFLLRPQSLNAFDDAFNLLDGGMGVAAGTFIKAAVAKTLQPMHSNTGQRCNGSACSLAAQLGLCGKRLSMHSVQRHSMAVESRPWVESGTQIQDFKYTASLWKTKHRVLLAKCFS